MLVLVSGTASLFFSVCLFFSSWCRKGRYRGGGCAERGYLELFGDASKGTSAGDTLIVLGTPDQVESLEQVVDE